MKPILKPSIDFYTRCEKILAITAVRLDLTTDRVKHTHTSAAAGFRI